MPFATDDHVSMPPPTMTADELAAELGRTPSWLYTQWGNLITDHGLPAPVRPTEAGRLVWNRAQVYAWLDRRLTPPQRIAAAAYRAAERAATMAMQRERTQLAVEDHRAQLDAQFGVRS